MNCQRLTKLGQRVMLLAGAALMPFVVGAQEASAAAPRTAALAGVVRDTLGRPLIGVTVVVDSTALSTVTDDSGRFHLKGVAPGLRDFSVRRIGFEPVAFRTTLAPDSTLVIAIRLQALQTLAPVSVIAERSVRLEKTGYYIREGQKIGSFVSPARVDSLSHLPSAGMLLRGYRGLDVECSAARCTVLPRNEPRCLRLFVNGVELTGQLDDYVSMSEVYAMEVYERPILVPAEFEGRLRQKSSLFTKKAGCGSLVVWTRGRAAP
jgi:hypothetical protein